jgi:arylsulfatase A-like enzyme
MRTLKRTHFITICLIVFCTIVRASERPNVLFIAIDDLNDWIGCLGGHPDAKTPNIDRLAAQGVLFTNAHCAGPVCNPSRTALLTGIRPSTSGVYDNGDEWRQSAVLKDAVTLPAHFRDHGYRAYGNGKIFHGQDRQSWSDWGIASGYDTAREGKIQKKAVGPIKWGAMEAGDEAMKDFQTERWVADELQKQHDQPFFLACGIFRPHLPWYAPKKYFVQYKDGSEELYDHRRDPNEWTNLASDPQCQDIKKEMMT